MGTYAVGKATDEMITELRELITAKGGVPVTNAQVIRYALRETIDKVKAAAKEQNYV